MTFLLRQPLVQDDAPARLAMPDQTLNAPFDDPNAPGIRTDRRTLALRAVILLVSICVVSGLGWLSLGWFALDGTLTLVEGALIFGSVFALFWVVLSVATATLGLLWRPRPQAQPLFGLQIAILVPMYGEPARSTIGTAVTLLAALPAAGRHSFSLHILSDTRDPDLALVEEATVAAARKAHPGLTIQYRRRPQNHDFKSGNIRDWVQTHGHTCEAMLILDADSVMGPQTVVQLADALAREPGLGLIQTVPRVLPGKTLWQGMQCFASEVYGRNMGRGFAMWTGAEANFFGHNALLRTRAFAASAGLPHLPGRAPRGGVILSHDFVEAALLRRAGWGVRMMPEAEESFEDTPETLIGYLRRDRRWCQGNMQHLRMLATPGLHPLSRFHLLQAAMAYLASVWWLVLLILWSMLGPGETLPDVFAAGPLFPVWPDLPPVTQAGIAASVGLMLMAPKLLGTLGHIWRQGLTLAQLPRFGTAMLVEIVLSALLAPVLMVHQVRAVLRVFGGLDGGWMPHAGSRSDWRTLVRFHATETGLGLGLLAFAAAGKLSPWLVPVAISLSLSVLLAALVQTRVTLFQPFDTARQAR